MLAQRGQEREKKMKKDNWRFEALARAKIVRQEEEAKAKMNCTKTDCLHFDNQLKKCSIEGNNPEDCYFHVTEEDYVAGENFRPKGGTK